jgi:hypothetical protein
MKNKLIIKVMALVMALLFFANCKKSTDNKPTVPIPVTGKGSVTVGGFTYSGDCILASTGEVQIINLNAPNPFLLRVLGMPQQSSGMFNFAGTTNMQFNGGSVQYYGGPTANVGQITKTGARSFQFSCTLYTVAIGVNGAAGTVPFYFTGSGSY